MLLNAHAHAWPGVALVVHDAVIIYATRVPLGLADLACCLHFCGRTDWMAAAASANVQAVLRGVYAEPGPFGMA